ncbi:tetratricopeptide repeat protein [Tenacibaculum maritimum]|uniref:Aerotolerance-related exported protein n=1 Tax=Tenacibaculum maritimum NCIMB 2154 TaxID=1349785 RepID=A0A2H1ED52_9FLAO|nr:tetratricopeptide repeat protein [Tenacibaculum maritimum]MCD9562591.1 tetratricopeptide repeat protein [Tenacibaculum maritimum]MCD9566019.1 tetratricopeptide repeat protein [Tenacibaculum maritimum]MCD9577762.1 tetratricopeptide repeat protein [Tenacibaculum maritimum]MCD9584919.1 tetratricopeptide repeat protein [Tenacibaculum maritimum]MCD9596681.1 tetratricopeptide repeat protein [Tenacibaculum maritimum]
MKKINNMKVLQKILLLCLFFAAATINAQQDTLQLQRESRALLREGNKLYNLQKYTDASVAYKKALGKNSKYDKASYNLGNAFYQEKNYKEAIPQFELTAKTAKDKFTKAEAYHNIGNAMLEQKKYQEAVDAYKNALRNNPNDDETRYNLAVAQKSLKKENQKNKNKNKDQQDKQDKNKKDNQQKEEQKDKKDQQKGGKDKDQQNQDKKDDQQKENQKNKKDEQQQKPQQGKMSPEQVKQLLESLNNEEKKTQKKMNVKKSKGKKIKQEKDW